MRLRFKFSIVLVFFILLFTSPTLAAPKTVTVTIPSYQTEVNGQAINNSNRTYPFLIYKDITYFPLTQSMGNALDLIIIWDNNDGLFIKKYENNQVSELKQETGTNNIIGKKYTAQLPEFKITVNNRPIDNNSEEFPLLTFRDITYFPLTWKFGVNDFGLKIDWDNQSGLKIESSAYSIANNKMSMSTRQIEGEKKIVREIVQEIQPATLLVETNNGLGSGFFVSPDGKVVTNAHVVRGTQWITVTTLEGYKYPATLTKINNYFDLAMLKVNTQTDVPYIKKFASTDVLSPGDEVIVFGNPLGYTGTVTKGMINAIREDRASEAWQGTFKTIQYDAVTAPGSSGGPAVNLYGECIGVNFAGIQSLNFNFAIPSQYYEILLLQEKYSLKDDFDSYWTEDYQWQKEINDIFNIKLNQGLFADAYTINNTILPRLNNLKNKVNSYSPVYDEIINLKQSLISILDKEIAVYNFYYQGIMDPFNGSSSIDAANTLINIANNEFTQYLQTRQMFLDQY